LRKKQLKIFAAVFPVVAQLLTPHVEKVWKKWGFRLSRFI